MGTGDGPGSDGRRHGGSGDGPAAADGTGEPAAGIDEYGRGEYDPVTGLYEWYEIPEGHAAQATGPSVDLEAVIDHDQDLIVADFAAVYGIRLHRTRNTDMTWREFLQLLIGLFADDSSRLGKREAAKARAAERDNHSTGGGDDVGTD